MSSGYEASSVVCVDLGQPNTVNGLYGFAHATDACSGEAGMRTSCLARTATVR